MSQHPATPATPSDHATTTGPMPAGEGCGLTVYYDGSCPLCRREIGLYQGLHAAQPLRWHDVSSQAPEDSQLSQSQAMARLHVRDARGQVLSGAAAFVALWACLPGWRHLARLARLPGVLWLMEGSYRGFLRLRPGLQALAKRLERA